MPTEIDAEDSAWLAEVWDRCLPGQHEMGQRVIAHYDEPHRHYHTRQHLGRVLREVEALADDHDLFLVRLAAFFHDAVYAIPAGQVSNEEASARLALRELSRAGLEQEDLNEIARLVRLTESHLPGSRDPEGELLCDADLAILAGSSADYAAYVAGITAEYARVPRVEFVAGRLEKLTALAERDVFRTSKGRVRNAQAKANLEAECRALAAELEALDPGRLVEGSAP